MSEDAMADDWVERLRVRIPGYRLLNMISQGGQATVYRAETEEYPHTIVAIKVLHEGPLADERARGRLRREAGVLAVLNSANIVKVHRWGETEDGHAFLVMDYIPGQPLDKFLTSFLSSATAQPDPAALPTLYLKICDAVEKAHERGIIHRDLSPSNIIVDHQLEPHILDFGLSRSAFDRFMQLGTDNASITGQFVGKLAYASPEQALGKRDQIDTRTDVYALGVILYQILTGGRFPYTVAGTTHDVLNNILYTAPTPPSDGISARSAQRQYSRLRWRKRQPAAVNPVIEAIVLKSLSKRPADRYRSAGELAQDIRNYLGGQPTLAKIASPATRLLQLPRQTVIKVAACCLLVLTVGTLAVWFWQLARTGRSASQLKLAAENGDVRAMTQLGYMYLKKSEVVPAEGPNALYWFRKAAAAGSADAMSALGVVYEEGSCGLTTKDPVQAIEWYKKSAEAGDSFGMLMLGGAYEMQLGGLPKDLNKAIFWYGQAASRGNAAAMTGLARIFERGGADVEKKPDLAIEWYRRAAQKGDSTAQAALTRKGLAW